MALTNPDHWLESRDDDALAGGANLAAVGEEIIHFGRAEPLGGGRFRLSRLLRGRGGSEHAIGSHGFAEAFVLLNPAALATIPLAAGHLGSTVTATAYGPANASSPPSVSRLATGAAARPLSPSHLAAVTDERGALCVAWMERSRSGWAWLDGVETPRDADFQGFRITITGSDGQIERSATDHQLTLEASELESLGTLRTIAVRQAGSVGLSPPATFNFEV